MQIRDNRALETVPTVVCDRKVSVLSNLPAEDMHQENRTSSHAEI